MDALEKLIKEREELQKAKDEVDEKLEKYFRPEVDRLLSLKKFNEAREYLRPMPIECVYKVLFFREIILTEQQENEK